LTIAGVAANHGGYRQYLNNVGKNWPFSQSWVPFQSRLGPCIQYSTLANQSPQMVFVHKHQCKLTLGNSIMAKESVRGGKFFIAYTLPLLNESFTMITCAIFIPHADMQPVRTPVS